MCLFRKISILLESILLDYRSGMQFPDYARESSSCHAAGDFVPTLCHYCLLLLAIRRLSKAGFVETISPSSKKVLPVPAFECSRSENHVQPSCLCFKRKLNLTKKRPACVVRPQPTGCRENKRSRRVDVVGLKLV